MTDRSAENFHYHPDRFPYFDSPHPHLTLMAVAYFDLSGRTRAENELITFAQDELLSCLLRDEQVICRLQGWSVSVSLPEIEKDIAGFLDRVAQHFGFSDRGKLVRMPPAPRTLVEEFLPEWWRLQDRLYAVYARGGEIFKAACMYVRDELQQPWRWLAYRLAIYVFEEGWERAMGIRMVCQTASYMDDALWGPRVQPFRFIFETGRHEAVAEAKRRLMAEAQQACANLQGADEPLPKGLFRKDHEYTTRRNTRWLYLHLICKKTQPVIAKTYHKERKKPSDHKRFPHCGCQETVRVGINRAERLLSLTPHNF